MTGKDPWSGRGACTDIGGILGGSYEGEPAVWFGDVGYEPPHGANLGGVPPPCDPAPQGEAPTTPHGRRLVYPPPPPLEDVLMEAGNE